MAASKTTGPTVRPPNPNFYVAHPDAASQHRSTLFEQTGIQFLALNSAWEIDEHFPKRCSIHDEALANGLLAVDTDVDRERRKGTLKDGCPVLRIAVWHHAISGNEKIADDAFMERLAKAGFRLVLHGDVHEGREMVWNPRDKTARQLHIAGAGSFAAGPTQRPESTPRLYNLIEIERDSDGRHKFMRIHTRKQERKGGAWGPYAKWPGSDKHTRSGKYEIELD